RGTLWAPFDHSHQSDPRRQMARLYRRPHIRRRYPRPPRSQRPSHRSRRREPQTPTLKIDPKGLTTSPQLCQKSTASRAPANQATSSRIAGRHHLGISGRLRRNLHRGDKWRLDEVVVIIAGKEHWLWRAVDQDGFVLDILVQSRRDKK